MSTSERDEREAGVSQVKTAKPETSNPRDTDHPTGTKQAAENEANESPS
jgi:hypothetical protein